MNSVFCLMLLFCSLLFFPMDKAENACAFISSPIPGDFGDQNKQSRDLGEGHFWAPGHQFSLSCNIPIFSLIHSQAQPHQMWRISFRVSLQIHFIWWAGASPCLPWPLPILQCTSSMEKSLCSPDLWFACLFALGCHTLRFPAVFLSRQPSLSSSPLALLAP